VYQVSHQRQLTILSIRLRHQANCVPDSQFRPRVIIVGTQDDRHSRVHKRVCLDTIYYPMWAKDELLEFRDCVWPEIPNSTFTERYRLFGGVPRYVFAPEILVSALIYGQNGALNMLQQSEIEAIVQCRRVSVGTFCNGRAKSDLMACEVDSSINGMFAEYRTTLVSENVRDQLYSAHAGMLWSIIMKQKEASVSGSFFRAYVHSLLVGRVNNDVLFEASS
jgi:hypothetical protein